MNLYQEQLNIFSSKAFKRLKEKTQIIENDKGFTSAADRMSHSLQVGIVSKMIADKLPQNFNISKERLFNVCLLHDIGHPPYGHYFETILNEILKENTKYKFEGNANNFVVIDKEHIEISDLTLVSLIKYPKRLDCKKGIYSYQYEKLIKKLAKEYINQQEFLIKHGYMSENKKKIKIVKKLLKNKDYDKLGELNLRTIESNIMEFSDDIAYLTQDIVDFLRSDLATSKRLIDYINKDNLDYINLSKEYKKILNKINLKNSEKQITKLRKLLIEDSFMNLKTGEMNFSSKESLFICNILRKISMDNFIIPVTDRISKKIDKEKVIKKYFNNLENEEKIKKIVVSDTYLKLILNTNNIEKRYRYMANFLAEKIDSWL